MGIILNKMVIVKEDYSRNIVTDSKVIELQ